MTVSNSSFVVITSVSSQPSETNIQPDTLFIDSSILTDVCENIFQELNKLVQARNNLVHKDNYVKQWRRLRE